jgi:large subunit ribosomal protein L10
MAKPEKVTAVAELREKFSSSSGAVLTEYRGLSVKALKQLRVSLGKDATYAVSKNTLTTIAAREAGLDALTEHLVGPTAIAFIDGDPVLVAKGLRDFARANPQLVIKAGVVDGSFLTSDDVRKLADLESREVLLAKAAGAMKGVLQQAVSLIAAPLSQAARLLGALEAAAADNPALLAGSTVSAVEEDTSEPTNDQLAADDLSGGTPRVEEVTPEPSNEELAAAAERSAALAQDAAFATAPVEEDTSEPTNEELAADGSSGAGAPVDETTSEPTNDELAAASPEGNDTNPAAAAAQTSPAADAAEDN